MPVHRPDNEDNDQIMKHTSSDQIILSKTFVFLQQIDYTSFHRTAANDVGRPPKDHVLVLDGKVTTFACALSVAVMFFLLVVLQKLVVWISVITLNQHLVQPVCKTSICSLQKISPNCNKPIIVI